MPRAPDWAIFNARSHQIGSSHWAPKTNHEKAMLNADIRQYALDHDPPIVVALMPYTPRHRAVAAGAVVAMLAVAAIVAPFGSVQLGRIDSFLPVVQTVLSAADLLTATLLFAQYSVQPHRALLVV